MGSSSSGNHGGKNCTDDYRALDVRSIKRAGRLTPGQSFGWSWTSNGKAIATINMQTDTDSVRLNYRQRAHGGEWQDMDYPVRLAYTPCNLGGHRVWWQCPAAGCWRRVVVLYGGSGIFCVSALLPAGLSQPAGIRG